MRDYVKERQQQKLWREKNKDRIKQYYQENKNKFVEYRKKYHESHKDEIRDRKKKYYSDPINAQKKAEGNKKLYNLNKSKILDRHLARRQNRKSFIDAVAMYYGCKNPNCKWNGAYQPCQLDFHHYNPKTKITEIARMHSASYNKIIDEINKCIVVCRNCHSLIHSGLVVLTETMKCCYQEYSKICM
jgi:hypothetical protein